MTVVGLQWVQSTNTYSCPAADSIGSLTPATRVAACNSIDPWMSMVRCNLWDTGVQTATYGDRCYTDTDVANMGQVMVKIKKFWYAMVYSAGTYRWYISSTGADSLPSGVSAWKVHPAFVRNSVTKNQIYLGAYEGYLNGSTSMLESKAGVSPTVSQTQVAFRTAAELRAGANYWEMQDYLTTCAVQLLLLLEYGSFGIQTLLGQGIDADTAIHNTGATGSTGTNRGNVSYGATANGTTAMSYRGIENFFGNIYKWTDGLSVSSFEPWVADHNFVFGAGSDMGFALDNSGGGWIQDFTTTSTYDYGFLPTTGQTQWGGNEAIGTLAVLTGSRVPRFGGPYNTAVSACPFSWDCYQSYSASMTDTGTRLMYIG